MIPILGQPAAPPPSIIVGPARLPATPRGASGSRMPDAPKIRTGDPFADLGDIVADCAQPGCGYHVMGPRALIKEALREHHRVFHPEETGVILLNTPRQ